MNHCIFCCNETFKLAFGTSPDHESILLVICVWLVLYQADSVYPGTAGQGRSAHRVERNSHAQTSQAGCAESSQPGGVSR